MGTFKEWLKETFGTGTKSSIDPKVIECLLEAQEFVYNQYAQSIVAERYGSFLSQCDFITYVNDEIVEKDVWYRLNVEPNPNQTSSEFMKQLARRLIFNGEALIIQTDNKNLYVASSFMKTDKQLAETYFENVFVDIYEDGSVPEYQLKGTFYGDKAIYIRYTNYEALRYITQMNKLYSDLIDNVKHAGVDALKYALELDTTALNGLGVDQNELIAKVLNEGFEALVNGKNAILPIYRGMKLQELGTAKNNAQNATTASQNVNSMFEDILINVGNIYNMPKSYMLGTYEANDEDNFLTIGLDPMASLITEAFNRRYYGKRAVLGNTYCRLDTKKVKHFDILTISDSINKLISSGVYTINEIRKLLDEPLIDKEIGDKHWITRNYAVVGDYIQELTNYTANDPKTQGNNGGQNEEQS